MASLIQGNQMMEVLKTKIMMGFRGGELLPVQGSDSDGPRGE